MATLRPLGNVGKFDDGTEKFHIFAAVIENSTATLNGMVLLFNFRNKVKADGTLGTYVNDFAVLPKDTVVQYNGAGKTAVANSILNKAVNWGDYASLGVSTGAGSNTQLDVAKFSPALPTTNSFNQAFLQNVGNLAILGTGETIQSVEKFFAADIDGDGKITTEVVITETGLDAGTGTTLSANSFVDDSVAYIKANPVKTIAIGSGVFIFGDYVINKKKSWFHRMFMKKGK